MSVHPPLLRSVAAHGLPGASSAWPELALDDAAWHRLLSGVRAQRLSGLLAAAVASGALPVTAAQEEEAASAHFEAVCGNLLIEASAVHLLARLEEAGVHARVLKGSAVAHLDYPDPSLRLFADLDLVVPSEQFGDAVATLAAAGHHRLSAEPRPGFDRRFSKGASFCTDEGLEVDLHRTFVMGPFGLRIRLEDLWESCSTFELGGRTVEALDSEVRFLHACFHAALGDKVARLVPQRDVAQMLLSGRLDLARVHDLMTAWQAEPVVARAVTMTWSTFGLADITALSDWARRFRATPRQDADLDVYLDPEGGYAEMSIAALRALPSLRQRAAFVYALAFFARRSTATSRWRRAAQAARRTVGVR